MDKAQKIKNLIGNEDACVREYFSSGPDGLASFLGITDRTGEVWKEVFSYFVFEKNLVFRCAILHIEVVQQILASLGPMELRKLMGIEDAEFDIAFEPIFDIAGLSCRSFYRYVVSHKKALASILLTEGPEVLRRHLCIPNAKYENLWEAVMDLLVEEFSRGRIQERMKNHQSIMVKLLPKLEAYLKGNGLMG